MTFTARSKTVKLTVMLSMTSAMFLTELIIGHVTNSITLIADSFHMLSDLLSLVVAVYAVRLGQRKQWSSQFTYGWQRAEVLGALINGVFLCALCFSVFIDSVQRLIALSLPSSSDGSAVEGVRDPLLVLWVGVAGLIVNLVGLLIFHEHHGHHGHGGEKAATGTSATNMLTPHEHSHHHHSHINEDHHPADLPPQKNHHKSLNMHGVFLHVLGDALGSVGVIISALVIHLTPTWPYSLLIDPIMSLLIIGIILFTTIPLVKTTAKILLQGVPDSLDIETLCGEVLQVDRVLDVHELHIWQLSDTKLVASIHVVIDSCSSRRQSQDATNAIQGSENDHSVFMDIATRIKQIFHSHNVHSVTIQPEYHATVSTASAPPNTNVNSDGKAITFHNGDKVITIEDSKEIACLLRCSANGEQMTMGCTVEDECCPEGVVREWKFARSHYQPVAEAAEVTTTTTSIVRSKTPSIPLEDIPKVVK